MFTHHNLFSTDIDEAFPLVELPVHAEPQPLKTNLLFEFNETVPPSLGHPTLALFDLDPVSGCFVRPVFIG